MSVILNGGNSGSAGTDVLYAASKVVTTLPFTAALYFQTGNNTGYMPSSSRGLVSLVDAAPAINGDWLITCRVSRSTGPILGFQSNVRTTTQSPSSYTTSTEFQQNVVSVTTGSSTQFVLAAPIPVNVGELVRVDGTLTGVSGMSAGRDYVVAEVSGSVVTLAISTTGTYTGAANLRPSAWLPNTWNLHVVTFKSTIDRRQAYGGAMVDRLNATTNHIPEITDIFTAANRLCLGGVYQNGAVIAPLTGKLCHVAIWNNKHVVRSEAIELLSVGPTEVTWGTPTAYWPLMENLNDVIGSNHLLSTGTPTFDSDQPSIFEGPPPPTAWELDDGERGVLLSGTGFGAQPGRLVVTQAPSPGGSMETEQIVESWSDTEIVFTVGRGQVPAATDVNLLVLAPETNQVLDTIVVNIAARTIPVRPASNILSDAALAAGS